MKGKPDVDFNQVFRESGMPETEEEIATLFHEDVQKTGLITNTSPMSPFWRLILTIVIRPVQWLRDALVDVVLPGMFVATADRSLLLLHAHDVNITPKPASKASGVIWFAKTRANDDVLIPEGTIVQTARINGVIYSMSVTEETLISSGKSGASVPVEATTEGSGHNLAPGYFRILPVAIPGIASVVNREDWLTVPGADEESDDELRDRIRNQFNLVSSYHTDAVYRGLIASVAGLSIDRIYFQHDAPRGPGTANAYLLLDSGEASAPFIEAVNRYINEEGHHGHGDDLQCFAMPETRHRLDVTAYIRSSTTLPPDGAEGLKQDIGDLIRCAFRENARFNVKKVWPYSRFSFSTLGKEIHQTFPVVASVQFSLEDIISDLAVPRLESLTVEVVIE
ncbi:hypothetical protein IRZ97_001476 [Escherichia coli]|nr:hypothetical protein [Escherichia coli]EGN0288836.1 hypothetical protein [Escherichia coli]HAV8141413.1 hypothetical protein [Escherichia coli]HAV8150816.1 hypothetical protein [Escherichia coli]HAW0742272.1 hypothetical protein [Escherichia coli]